MHLTSVVISAQISPPCAQGPQVWYETRLLPAFWTEVAREPFRGRGGRLGQGLGDFGDGRVDQQPVANLDRRDRPIAAGLLLDAPSVVSMLVTIDVDHRSLDAGLGEPTRETAAVPAPASRVNGDGRSDFSSYLIDHIRVAAQQPLSTQQGGQAELASFRFFSATMSSALLPHPGQNLDSSATAMPQKGHGPSTG